MGIAPKGASISVLEQKGLHPALRPTCPICLPERRDTPRQPDEVGLLMGKWGHEAWPGRVAGRLPDPSRACSRPASTLPPTALGAGPAAGRACARPPAPRLTSEFHLDAGLACGRAHVARDCPCGCRPCVATTQTPRALCPRLCAGDVPCSRGGVGVLRTRCPSWSRRDPGRVPTPSGGPPPRAEKGAGALQLQLGSMMRWRLVPRSGTRRPCWRRWVLGSETWLLRRELR